MPVTLQFTADLAEPDLYNDINGLPEPFNLYAYVGIANTYTAGLYFRVSLVSPPAAYSYHQNDLGLVGAGGSQIFGVLLTRTLPTLTAGEYDETITMKVEAFTDSGYTSLYGYKTLDVAVHHFDHSDPSWTVLDFDNFNGSTENWSSMLGKIDSSGSGSDNNSPSVYASPFYSSPSSLTGIRVSSGTGYSARKYFNTSGRTKARFIAHFYLPTYAEWFSLGFALSINGRLVVPCFVSKKFPRDTWFRLAFNIEIGASIAVIWQPDISWTDGNKIFMDDVYVIAK